ncbi:MAG: response regulator [Verrucomicrobiota bacterium]|jgi:signal transduction histidine kinase
MAIPLKVLIAEDSPDDADLLVAQLRRDGFDPVWKRVEEEKDFLRELEKRPDVVLSDYSMPQFSGLRAAELTRQSGLNIPFLLVSGTVGEDAAVDAMKHGATDYLLKDRMGRLGSAVERALEEKRLFDERRRTAEALRWQTTLLEAQLESSLDGILVVDNQGRKILQNRRMEELWKNPRTDAGEKVEAAKAAFDPDFEKHPRQFIEKVAYLNAHPDEASHDVIELIDGTVLDRYSAPVRDKAGANCGRIWSFRDITERRKLEAQFRQAQKMESIGMLAGGIAHDFNNILSAILGNLYLVKLEATGHPELMEPLENISQAAKRAGDLVNQILTFSRQNKQEREPLKLNHVVLEALKLLRASVPATIQIQTNLTQTPTVLANATAVHQVIMNLGTNAWHAMREKPGILKLEMGELEADVDFAGAHPGLHTGRYVRLAVSDTGHGMDAATIERIFDPFFTTKAVGEGTGLGLAVVLGIMQSHDGAITVYSEPGHGTTFHLYFPVFEMEAAPPESGVRAIPRGNGEHILFVDDEAPLLNVGKKMLERLGYTVTAKGNALEAISAVRDHPGTFQLVVTDLTMPVMDGIKLGKQLLQIEPGLRIILSTGYSGMITEDTIHELGFRGLLVKPTTARALGEAVQAALAGDSAVS